VPAKLLIADDSTTIQKVFERNFPTEEFTLSFANDGEEALAKARTERPNLIIADISMPVKNGFEVCATLKQDPVFKDIPVLLLIGILDDFDEDESRRAGADGFIVKPFEVNAALNKVRAALAKGKGTLPRGEPAGRQADEILELTDVMEGPPATLPPLQRQGAEEILELEDIIKESPSTPPSPQKQKEEEFVLQSSLRELEQELKAEFPEEQEEDKAAPSFTGEEKKESWNLELDLPFDELELEPKSKDADWTGLFGDMSMEKPGQEIKDERLETILGESATELEKIEGLALGKDVEAKEKAEEFAEKFMEDFEPVFAPGEDLHHIDVLEKDQKRPAAEDAEDLAERVAAALGRELKGAMEEVLKNKVPKLVRQAMEQSKKG
jgi:CheY-like chemotaxis protein